MEILGEQAGVRTKGSDSMAGKIRHNYLAIVAAAALYFLVEGVWFTLLLKPWLAGVGRSMSELQALQGGHSPAWPYIVASLSALAIAMAMSWVIQAAGPQTALHGAEVAATLWFGFVLTTWATEYAFEIRGLQTLAINAGFPLVGMVMQGALLGAWKAKAT